MFENNKITVIEGTGVPLRGNEIDTDRIIPARYLKCVTFDGLGEYAFYDERFDGKGNLKEHPFNEDKYKGGSILVVNKNFGCGSSREHAPQALMRFGISVVIGESFAEIFAGNCTTMGIPTLTASEEEIENLMQFVVVNPEVKININLEDKTAGYDDFKIGVNIPEPSRFVLVEGKWDSTAQLLTNKKEIQETADRIPYLTYLR